MGWLSYALALTVSLSMVNLSASSRSYSSSSTDDVNGCSVLNRWRAESESVSPIMLRFKMSQSYSQKAYSSPNMGSNAARNSFSISFIFLACVSLGKVLFCTFDRYAFSMSVLMCWQLYFGKFMYIFLKLQLSNAISTNCLISSRSSFIQINKQVNMTSFGSYLVSLKNFLVELEFEGID